MARFVSRHSSGALLDHGLAARKQGTLSRVGPVHKAVARRRMPQPTLFQHYIRARRRSCCLNAPVHRTVIASEAPLPRLRCNWLLGVVRRKLRPLDCSGTSVAGGRQRAGDSGRSGAALGMAPAARAYALLLSRLRGDVVHDVVRAGGIPAHPRWHVVEHQVMPCLPTDVVIGARGIATHAKSTHDLPTTIVEREPATEYIYAADLSAIHRIIGPAVVNSIPSICDLRVHWVAVLKAVQRSARRHRGINVGRGQSKTGQTEGVARVGLLRGNHAAAWPLIPALLACEGDRTDDSIAVHYGAPHIEIETSVRLVARLL